MPEFDEFGIPIKKTTPEVEVDEFGIPFKKNESPNQKPVSVGSKPLPQDGGLSPFISKPKEEKLKGFGEVGVTELEKQGVVQPPPPMRIEPTIDPNVTQQLREQKTQEDIARETKVDTKRNEYNFVKAFKSGVDDFKRAEDIFTDLIAVDVTGDPTPLINRMEQEYAEYKKRGVVNKYEETPAAYVANLFGNQAITIAGALGTSALLSPIVGIAYGGIAAGSQSAGATFEQDYYELRDKGLSPEEAYKQAYELAQTSLGFGAIEGTAGAFVPAGKLATGVKEATKQVAKDALFDVSIATVAQGAQNEIEANKGLSRELTDGMVENATGEAVFSIIMGSFVKGREVLKNKPKVLYELSQAPEEVIQADLEARVENGVATPEEAEAAMQDIIQYKEKLTKVPDNFTDEQKQKSVELITQRDELQASIEGKDEALVKPQKEQIELINTQLEQIANEPITGDEIRGTDAVKEAVGEQPAISETGVEETVTEEVVLPEQGEEVQLEPRIKGGQARIMVYDEGVWKEKVGNTLSEVSSKQQQEAQEKYANEKPSPTQMDVGEQARDGEEMGERNPQEEITQEGEEEVAVEPSAIEKGQVSGDVTTEPDALKDVESLTSKAKELSLLNEKEQKRILDLAANEATLSKQESQELSILRRKRDKGMQNLEREFRDISERNGGETNPKSFNRQDRQQWRLLQRELQMVNEAGADVQQTKYGKIALQEWDNYISTDAGKNWLKNTDPTSKNLQGRGGRERYENKVGAEKKPMGVGIQRGDTWDKRNSKKGRNDSFNIEEEVNKGDAINTGDYNTIEEQGKIIESTAKALEGVDTQLLKKQLGIDANWDMIGEGDALSGKDPVLAYTQKRLPEWNRESQLGNINSNSKLTYDIARGETLAKGTKFETKTQDKTDIALAKDENGITVGVVELDNNGGIKHIAVAPEFRGKGVADNLIKVLKENNPNLDLSKTKLRSKGFEKAFSNKIISEAYHKAKADGSNPELVAAVEELLGKPQKSQAKPLQTEAESKAKAELEPEIKSNLEKIQEETGVNFREIQNVYTKYGEGKPLNEITVEDYRRAEAKRQAEKEPTEKQIADTAQKAGITPQNLRDLYKINRELFGLDRIKSLASAIAMDKMVGVMAKRANITKAEMYGRLKFEKASEQDLPQGVKFQVDAWHGSPYEFDKFELSKIGTGEGAQAFGWGLYFTDLESIARNYADKLSQKDSVLISEVDKSDLSEKSKTLIKGHYINSDSKESAIELLKANSDGSSDFVDAINFLQKYKEPKNLYKVSLHKGKTPDQYTWLEWDKPLTDDFLKKFNKELSNYDWDDIYFTNDEDTANEDKKARFVETGEDLYKAISSQLWKWNGDRADWSSNKRMDKDASEMLLEMGIDGIKYPAESISRGATSDTARGFNYVVFDENAVSIEEVIKFQKDAEKARGAMMIGMDGQAVIYALTDPNVSTPLHEMAHVFEHYMTDAERAIVQSWAGTKGWTTQTSEKFARGFEKYLAEGKAPTSGLQKIFDKFKTWLTDIYNGITGSDIDIELNEPMREIYAKMLGAEAVKPAKAKKAPKSAPKVITSETIKEIVPEKTIEAVKALTRAKKAMTETARTKVEETAKDAPNFDKAKYIMDNLENIKAKLLESGKLTTDCKWG